jgi:ribosomal 50S subunit-recycling heat shock protein
MRLDKYLKLSRLVKRRAVAQEMIMVDAVRVNGRKAKPSTEVRLADRVDVAYPRRILSVTVTDADEKSLKRGAVSYEVLEDRRVSGEEAPW